MAEHLLWEREVVSLNLGRAIPKAPKMVPVASLLGAQHYIASLARGATWDDFSGQLFCIFEIIIFCFVVAICDLVHDVETIFHLSYVLTASGNLL